MSISRVFFGTSVYTCGMNWIREMHVQGGRDDGHGTAREGFRALLRVDESKHGRPQGIKRLTVFVFLV